ncbi:MAG: Zn-ribbon domain-containing OB-fold protein [Gammaproteobacteria bacterium]
MSVKRALPLVSIDAEAFWKGGADGRLHIHRCGDCGYYVHPPVRFCPECESRNVAPQPVSGRGKVASYTVNEKQWFPDLEVPYVLALVELAEQADIRLPTNIRRCSPYDVYIGMPVKVFFEQHEDCWVPFFEPEQAR